MSGKTYYKILNLPEGASKAQIKKSYRTLVKLYHPDVTDDPKAHDKYIEINQAYEALTEPQKKKTYSSNTSSRQYKWNKYREQSRNKHRARKEKAEKEIQEFYTSLRKGWRRNWIKANMLVGMIICFLTIADQYSVPTQRKIAILSLSNYSRSNEIITEEGQFQLKEGHASIRGKNEVILFESKYLKHGMFVAYQHEGVYVWQKVLYSPQGPSFYWGYKIIVFVSALPLLFFIFFRKNHEWFVFFHYAILIVTTPWLIYFILKHPIIMIILKFGAV